MHVEYFSNLSCLSKLELKCAMIGKDLVDPEVTENFKAFDQEGTTWYFIDTDGNAVLFGNPEPKSIGVFAFENCTPLKSVNIPTSVIRIGDYAFSHCTSLMFVSIPASVTSIGDWAFNYCTSLTAIPVDAANSNYASVDGVLYDKDMTELIQCPGGKKGSVNIPASVTSIGQYAFYRCSSLTSVSIPASVTSIGASAFMDCTSLRSVSIPASVTSIGDGAFAGCSSLKSIKLPDSIEDIGVAAFPEGCEVIQ